ncbi:MAG TPA: gamma-glutamyltransferase [Gemmatimonadaceae bacterium]|nr:gamma-glutamyltransferase [Gemmatimonadaceae bacterium]
MIRRALLPLTLLLVPSLLVAQQGRPDVSGATAAVTASHPLAAAAGADVLRRGGNAVDAAITMAAVLAVVRPHMNGIGGDNFMLIHDATAGAVHALNGSGRAGSRATPASFRERGLEAIPSSGVLSVSVPGAVRAWEDALRRFGTISLADALAPAIRHAERGFAVSTRLSLDIDGERARIARDTAMARVFLHGGSAPAPGTVLRQPELARTLRAIAAGGADELYGGATARTVAALMDREQGLITLDDLRSHRSTWQEPIETSYHGLRILAFPPNTQGVALLAQLNIAERFDLRAMGHNSADYIHTLVGGARLAYEDRDRYVADPEFADVPVARLISKEYARERAALLRARGRVTPELEEGRDGSGDTVFLCVIDADGNAVSMIQSLFAAFGSARMVPGTGIVLHNRGALYSLDATHPNVVAPRKRPYHTLSPSMALRADGSLHAVLGTPGGDGQPQTVLQVLNNILLFGMTPQQAVEAPRWRSSGTNRVAVEPGIADSVRAALVAAGHDARTAPAGAEFGGAQIILVHPESRMRMTGADPRREAYGIAW